MSRWVQLVLGTTVVVGVPVFVRFPDAIWMLDFHFADWVVVSCIGNAVAFIVGLIMVLELARFPKVEGVAFVVPVFLIAFGALFAVILLWRLDFSRYLLFSSLALAVLWGMAYVLAYNRTRRLHLAIVPFGAIDLPEVGARVTIEFLETSETLPACDAVVADLRAEMPASWKRMLADCALHRLPVYHVKQLAESLTGRVHIEYLSENHFGALLVPRFYETIKRLADLLGIVVLAPLLIVLLGGVALLIRIDGDGPVLFIQTRMGFRGRPFRMLKFRTMTAGADGPDFTTPDDTRISPRGRFLRRHRLDELPQVINILKGEMSWIGPRPESLPLAAWYDEEVPFYRYRHIVRPGLTGWAQVHQGQAAGVDQAGEKLQYDFFYIKHYSPWLDLLISFKTLRIMLTGYGAR